MKVHCLKTIQPYFTQVQNGEKDFELRKDDRDYEVGDQVILEEFVDGVLTGYYEPKEIKYILRDCPQFGLMEGYCILGLTND